MYWDALLGSCCVHYAGSSHSRCLFRQPHTEPLQRAECSAPCIVWETCGVERAQTCTACVHAALAGLRQGRDAWRGCPTPRSTLRMV